MNAFFTLNGEDISYLLHGQSFRLGIKAEGCWFLLIRYDSGLSFFRRWSIRRPVCVYQNVTNAYRPHLQVWGVGLTVRCLMHRDLNINFLNVRQQDLAIHAISRPFFPRMSVRLRRLTPMVSVPRLINTAFGQKTPSLSHIRGQNLSFRKHDDYTSFKTDYKNPTNQHKEVL
jgi:hypothetical protein